MNFWNVHVCEMRNFKSGRKRNSLSVYLFKIQCSCATIGPTGLQVRSFIAFSITLQIVICLVHIIAAWNKCQTSIDQHAMFPLIGDQYTTFSLILWRQFIWNAAKAIYMEYRESASGLFHKTCLGNIMLCSKVVISFQTRTIPTHKQLCKT